MLDIQEDFFGAGYLFNPLELQQAQQESMPESASEFQTQLPTNMAQLNVNNKGAGVSNTAAPARSSSYQGMQGWDTNKLNSTNADTLKYLFGRFIQDNGYFNGGDASQYRGNMQGIVDAFNRQYGQNARTVGDDSIDFGNGWNGVDLINGQTNQWQWGAWNDPNSAPAASRARTSSVPQMPQFQMPTSNGFPMYGNTGWNTMGLMSTGGTPRSMPMMDNPMQNLLMSVDPYERGGIQSDPTFGGYSTSGGYNGSMPADLGPIRTYLQDYLMGHLNAYTMPVPFPNTLLTDTPWGLTQAYNRYIAGPDQVNGMIQPMLGTFGSVFNQAQDLAKNGGMPNLDPLMNSIQNRSQLMLDENLAGIREQYGQLGLGTGSDVDTALARGSATGVADMQQQMLQAALQASMQGGANRLGALGVMSGLPGSYGNLALGQGQLWNQSAGGLLGVGGLEQQVNADNLSRYYNEFIRQTSPSPWLNAALGYATGFPPMSQQQSSWPSVAAGGLNAGASIIGALIAGGVFSDKTLKDRVEPINTDDVLQKVRELDVNTWHYLKQDAKHMGPMAQDFKRLFGVGDGQIIMTVDALGVVYAAMQSMAKKIEELEARLG